MYMHTYLLLSLWVPFILIRMVLEGHFPVGLLQLTLGGIG